MTMEELKIQLFENRPDVNNAAVKLLGINVIDPDNPSSERDYATAALLHDAFGLKAEFDANGTPTTEIRFQVSRTETERPDWAPPSIAKLTQKHGRWKPIPIGGIVILEDAFMHERTRTVHAEWLKTGVRDTLSGRESCVVAGRNGIPNLMTVEFERRINKRDGTHAQRQNRYRVHQLEAVEFKGMSEFKETAVGLLDIEPDLSEIKDDDILSYYRNNCDGRGIPCVAIRGIALEREGSNNLIYSFAKRIERGWNRMQNRRMTAEEAVDNFFKGDHNTGWIEEIRKSSSSAYGNTLYEILPLQRYNTDGKNLPSNTSQPAGFDDSIQFQSPVLNEYDELFLRKDGQPKISTGFTPAIMLSVRMESGAEHPWYVRKTLRIDHAAPIVPLAEIPTPNMPDYLAERVYERAEKRACIIEELEAEYQEYLEAGAANPSPDDSNPNAGGCHELENGNGFTP